MRFLCSAAVRPWQPNLNTCKRQTQDSETSIKISSNSSSQLLPCFSLRLLFGQKTPKLAFASPWCWRQRPFSFSAAFGSLAIADQSHYNSSTQWHTQAVLPKRSVDPVQAQTPYHWSEGDSSIPRGDSPYHQPSRTSKSFSTLDATCVSLLR